MFVKGLLITAYFFQAGVHLESLWLPPRKPDDFANH
jgi:hypothetical protein